MVTSFIYVRMCLRQNRSESLFWSDVVENMFVNRIRKTMQNKTSLVCQQSNAMSDLFLTYNSLWCLS